ncbi:MAG: hypothetical protein ACF8PN_10900 [Phycisphaerales bacterium]
MLRVQTTLITLLTLMILAQDATAQCRYFQPWAQRRASHTSIVRSCDIPEPMDLAALDDFICDNNGTLAGVRWWGVVLNQEQLREGRRYYLAIFEDNGNCEPDAEPIYKACLNPSIQRSGVDCSRRRVYQFTSQVPPFPIEGGTRYWIQISEDDSTSARSGVEDFRWSGRLEQRGCPAVQAVVGGGIISPLLDPCAQVPVDLSFALVTL